MTHEQLMVIVAAEALLKRTKPIGMVHSSRRFYRHLSFFTRELVSLLRAVEAMQDSETPL